MGDFDALLEKVGPFGRYQIVFCSIYCVFITLGQTQNVLNVILLAMPDYWCHADLPTNQRTVSNISIIAPSSEGLGSCSYTITNVSGIEEIIYHKSTDKYAGSTPCRAFSYDYSVYGVTAVTKWDLVCSKSWYRSVPQALYMLGFTIGCPVWGNMADRFGRKITIYTGLCCDILFGTSSSFVSHFWGHVTLRMLAGFGASGHYTTSIVIAMELVGKKYRTIPGLGASVFAGTCTWILAFTAYFLRDFIWTNFAISIGGSVLFLGIIFLPESPRWLMARGRLKEAKQELTKAVKMNKTAVDVDQLIDEYVSMDSKKEVEDERKYTILDLLRTPNLRRKTLIHCFLLFVAVQLYYGLLLDLTELTGDPYVNLALSGVFEQLGYVLALVTMERLGRSTGMTIVMAIGAASCFACAVSQSEFFVVYNVFSFIGRFAVCGGCGIMYVYCAELSPTVARSIGTGLSAMSAHVAATLAPFVNDLKIVWPPLPMVLYGISALVGCMLSLLLPETLGQCLPDTLEEGEAFGRGKTLFCFKRKKNEEEIDLKTPLVRADG